MFQEFPKIARLNRECIITEKIDGTNAQVLIVAEPELRCEAVPDGPDIHDLVARTAAGYYVFAGSRTRYVTPQDDNYGFAAWVQKHADELVESLGPGRHYGEWWGQGIQRKYGLSEKRFSLFNTSRWFEPPFPNAPALAPGNMTIVPKCCHVVPVLYRGPFKTEVVGTAIERLKTLGSVAAPGFMKPEGVVVYHTAANLYFKVTVEKDESPKSTVSSGDPK